ncbi:dedicator of cytokinesis protein 1 [Cydia amplana]|uniref:dedicator of cytokinesis protein 1 n=1 Tax=Cydia amplana TaxID=1869771 RepID=UPI002FE61325
MTVWRIIEDENCYAVAIYNYTGPSPHLPLEVGELVHCERETEHWYWGRSLRRDGVGAFPKNYVQLRECQVERVGETVVASAGGSGVVHDIALTLRDWLQHWKKLYTTCDERFKFMEVSMRALLELRAQAASGALPLDQLRRVARTAIFTIDKGNRALDMELAVRNANGQLVNPLNMSTYKLNALHDETNAKIDKNMETTPASPPSTTHPSARSYTVAVKVHNFVCRMTDSAELLLSLHDSSGNKLTEHLMMRWPSPNMSTGQVVFTDLGSEIKREKTFLVCHVVRIGSMAPENVDYRRSMAGVPPPPNSGGGLRRPFGVAVADVTRPLADHSHSPDRHIQAPFYACEKETMDTLLKKVITNRELKETKHQQGLWVSIQLVDGDLKQVREENPHILVSNTAIARKMGFPEVIRPGDTRNDLYVTLCSGSFSRGGVKNSERNIELCARIVDKNGQIVPGVISVGAGVQKVNEYTSLVYYHEDRPRWQETFKVCLGIEEFKEAHLVFLCRHRSSNEAKDRAEKHFALSFLKLMQREGTTTPDKHHTLCVYKIDSKKASTEDIESEAAAACLALPSRRDELPAQSERGLVRGPLSLVHRDSLVVHSKLCSTKLTQREEILGVLKWNTHHAEGTLRQALTRLMHVPSEELVKFLQDILDALFSILTQVPEEQESYTENSYGVLVLESLMRVVSLVADHKYQHFQPVLYAYIDDSFCDALAYEKLISVIVWVITSAEQGELALKRLLQCMKCLECLIRFIVRSRQLRSALGDPQAHEDFRFQFESLMEALVWLMRCGDYALTCQGSALKYLPHAVPHAIKVFPPTELSALVVRALDALPLSRLGKQRMLALLELVRGALGGAAGARALLAPHVANTARALLMEKVELDREAAHKSRSVDKAARLLGADSSRLHDPTQHQQIVELCVETLGELVTLLARDDVGPVEADRGELAKLVLPTVLRVAANMMRDDRNNDDPLLRRIVSILLDIVRQMSEEQYALVVKALEQETGGSASLVVDALALLQALLQRPVFRAHWADMLHVQHYVMLHALRLISITLCNRLQSIDETDTEGIAAIHSMCRSWFNTCASLASSEPLQLETMRAARRARAAAVCGDVRRAAAALLRDLWFALGDHKRTFIPCLVGPFLEVSFLCDEEVRITTIPLFFDMMQTEYNHSVSTGDSSESPLKDLESELIDKIDVLVERGSGDVAWRARFVSLCGALCKAATGGLRAAAAALVAAAARQLDTLLQYRAAALKSAISHRMLLTTKVLHFYEQIERPHMYIRYVHKLCDMHRSCNQWAEAGLTLRLHARLLSWLPAPIDQPTQPQTTSERDLKEMLYHEVADLLDQGHQWEVAVEVIKELVEVYEAEALGYAPLADLHSRLAAFYTAMMRTVRSHPGYFRVVYFGKGFPDHLRVPHGFVYRGNEYEQLGDFKERLLDEWPEAEVLPKLDPPGDEVTEAEGQYLQINAVEPVMGDKLKRLSGKPISGQILQYYKHNHVSKFIFSRPFHRPEEQLDGSKDDLSVNEFATRWLERTELEISDMLPGILRWFPVVRQRTFWVSPVEAAVEALRDANRALKQLVLEARASDAPLQPLTMRLSGILDPAVQGGIVNYERAFLTPTYAEKHPDHAPLLAQLRDLIADQIPLLQFGLDVHGARMPTALEGLHAHMLQCFRRIQNHVHQRYGRKACDFESEAAEVQLRMPPRDRSYTETQTSNRVSDISTGTSTDSASKSKFFSFNAAINPLARNSAASNYFGTLNSSPKKKERRRARKSEIGTQASGSQWYTSPFANGTNNSINTSHASNTSLASQSDSPLRELRQENFQSTMAARIQNALVTERPLRAEVEQRRMSQRASLVSAPPSNRNSIGTTDSNQEDEEPPPLPEKSGNRSTLDSDHNNNPEPLPPRNNYDTGTTDSNQEDEEPPPLPEKSGNRSALDSDHNNNPEPLPPRNNYDTGTTDSNQEDEEPPPLPEKSGNRSALDSDHNNNPEPLPPRNNYDTGTTDSNQEDEEPPPLPEKSGNRSTLDSDHNNNPEPLPPRNNYDTVLTPRGSFLYNSMMRRTSAGIPVGLTPPTPPPKKKHQQQHQS